MSKHTIRIELSAKSVRDAIQDLKKYEADLTYKCQLLAERLAEKGVEIARVQLADLDAIFKGELISSIQAEYQTSKDGGSVWAVVAGTDHVVFVEFGTGVVGKANPYPGKLPKGIKWNYAKGKTIHQISDGRYGWFYPGDDGNWYFTEGMPSRPFMYNTANELKSILVDTAREVFGDGE